MRKKYKMICVFELDEKSIHEMEEAVTDMKTDIGKDKAGTTLLSVSVEEQTE